jgi:hypothetical protein
MDRKSTVLRWAILGFGVIITAGFALLFTQFATVRRFDADPSCRAANARVVTGACVLRPVRIARTMANSVGRSGRAHYVAFYDDNGAMKVAQIVPADTVFVQMFHPGDTVDAVFFQGQAVRIAFRQYWLQTEADPHRVVFKIELILAITVAVFAIVATTVYQRTGRP